MFNGQQIVGLCKSLTLNAVNFKKVNNSEQLTFNGVRTFVN
jgi:hypothetical protein